MKTIVRHSLFAAIVLTLLSQVTRAQSVPQAITTQTSTTQSQPTLVADSKRSGSPSRILPTQYFQITSAILKETREIQIVLPASYNQTAQDRRYPVTIVVDGEYLAPSVSTVSEALARNGQIPESVIVGIENTGATNSLSANDKRVYDLTPPGLSVSGSDLNQGGDLFLDFIEKELLPAVDRQFRTSAPRFFIGVSSGGVLATYVAATRTYSAVVSLDAPVNISDNWLAKKMIASAKQQQRPVRYASLEARFGWPEEEWKSLLSVKPASWKLYREKFELEGHETMQMLGAYIGLRQVFSDYSRLSAPEFPTTSILPYYRKVNESLGASIVPPKRLLENVVNDLLMEGRGKEAREAYNILAAGYGPPPNNEQLMARIVEVERQPPPTETVESLMATPFPKPDEIRNYIGDWVGDVWLGANEPQPGRVTLRIRVENNQVMAEIIRKTEAGERAGKIEYLKVTRVGLTYGFMNGMRPRAMNLFEGTLTGDTLSGKKRFGGIRFEEKGPPLQFLFKRAPKPSSSTPSS